MSSFLNSVLSSIGQAGDMPSPSAQTLAAASKQYNSGRIATNGGKSVNTSIKSKTDLGDLKNSSNKSSHFKKANSKTASKPSASSNKTASSHTESPEPAKPLKKGSYREIMARAQMTKITKGPSVGSINHKRKDKSELSFKGEMKRRRKMHKAGESGLSERDPKKRRTGNTQTQVQARSDLKQIVKPPRPQPQYKGTMVKTARPEKSGMRRDTVVEDVYSSDNAEEYCSEDESDDMEAGFSDVEAEEEAAERAARREDAAEARLEESLRRDKEERRRRLLESARKARSKRP